MRKIIGVLTFLFVGFVSAISQNSPVNYNSKPTEPLKYKGMIFYMLPYNYNALDAYIDKETVFIHYQLHHLAYFKKYAEAVEGKAEAKLTLPQLFKSISRYSDLLRNNAGGYFNHILYWQIMNPENKLDKPQGELEKAILKYFGSFENLIAKMNEASLSRFGSGWSWLSVNKKKELFISTTANQDNPLMDVVKENGTPILAIDVWEHAYYLKYQNKRKDYVGNFWNVINWREVEKLYVEALK
jgi:superoxide dismutase, Fe-Mn family